MLSYFKVICNFTLSVWFTNFHKKLTKNVFYTLQVHFIYLFGNTVSFCILCPQTFGVISCDLKQQR